MGSWYFLGFCAAIALLAAILAATQTITIPLALSGFLAVTFSPAVDWLEVRGFRRGQPVNYQYLHTWTMRHFARLIRQFETSVAQEPLIPLGAPVDHVPGADRT